MKTKKLTCAFSLGESVLLLILLSMMSRFVACWFHVLVMLSLLGPPPLLRIPGWKISSVLSSCLHTFSLQSHLLLVTHLFLWNLLPPPPSQQKRQCSQDSVLSSWLSHNLFLSFHKKSQSSSPSPVNKPILYFTLSLCLLSRFSGSSEAVSIPIWQLQEMT